MEIWVPCVCHDNNLFRKEVFSWKMAGTLISYPYTVVLCYDRRSCVRSLSAILWFMTRFCCLTEVCSACWELSVGSCSFVFGECLSVEVSDRDWADRFRVQSVCHNSADRLQVWVNNGDFRVRWGGVFLRLYVIYQWLEYCGTGNASSFLNYTKQR